jgi:hypothetical protein
MPTISHTDEIHQLKVDQIDNFVNQPKAEFLPMLQSFMIILILFTYRGPPVSPSPIVDTKRMCRLFNYIGIFDQRRIDAENPRDPIAREQYQRYVKP